MNDVRRLIDQAVAGTQLTREDALHLTPCDDLQALTAGARQLRDQGFRNTITYSKKVFIPVTQLCRDVCHYCTFAQTPKHLDAPYLTVAQAIEIAEQGARLGCKEALFTLGERPELRYRAAREALQQLGFDSTVEYLRHMADQVFQQTGLLPHLNPGTMTDAEIALLRPVAPSMGLMLESTSDRLTEKGQPHYGSPDKVPAVRLDTLDRVGRAQIPFTSGILIGIGETRAERIESLLAIRELHERHGHIQEIIVQNFRAKEGTKMVNAPEPTLDDLVWTLAVARLIFGAGMSIQAPPNLSPGVLPQLVDAGINDWGGISPLTPDFVNPEAPWPHLEQLAQETANAGKYLDERITVYPAYVHQLDRWVDPGLHPAVLRQVDGEGFGRREAWVPGSTEEPPVADIGRIRAVPRGVSADVQALIERCTTNPEQLLTETEVVRLLQARGDDFSAVCQAADQVRHQHHGDVVSWAVNRNINYTNVCYFRCQFCAFSKGKASENLRGKPYDLDPGEIARRVTEAWDRGATEVCMQGGIHPSYTGDTYINILQTVKTAVPEMHIHAFSPLEVWQGAGTLKMPLKDYLERLKQAGLDTLPGTAAEILDDDVRAIICPDKINTEQWLEVMRTAHQVGFRTTATIMYGHVERPEHCARHLLRVRDLQRETGGFTEFVPLPFVHMEAPVYLKGKARPGPTFREAILLHAVARLTLNPWIPHIQASWVKMGHAGVVAALNAGCDDLGGTLMNESITRAAGAEHGQETSPDHMLALIKAAGRVPRQRNTVYGEVSEERQQAAFAAGELTDIINTPARRHERPKERQPLLRSATIRVVNQ